MFDPSLYTNVKGISGRRSIRELCAGIGYAHLMMTLVSNSGIDAGMNRIWAATFFAWAEIFN